MAGFFQKFSTILRLTKVDISGVSKKGKPKHSCTADPESHNFGEHKS